MRARMQFAGAKPLETVAALISARYPLSLSAALRGSRIRRAPRLAFVCPREYPPPRDSAEMKACLAFSRTRGRERERTRVFPRTQWSVKDSRATSRADNKEERGIKRFPRVHRRIVSAKVNFPIGKSQATVKRVKR